MPVDKFTVVALALGSNVGDRLGALRAAVKALKALLEVEMISPVYETAAAYVTDQPVFLNAALVGRTALSAIELLRKLKQIESEVGRKPSFRNGPRLLDIDILFYGEMVSQQPELIVPHPRLQERRFVLQPLADIAPDWQHPVSGVTVKAMLAALPEGEDKPERLDELLA